MKTGNFCTLYDVFGLQAKILILFDLLQLFGSNIKLNAIFLNHASILSLLNFHLFLSFLFACCSKLCKVCLFLNFLFRMIWNLLVCRSLWFFLQSLCRILFDTFFSRCLSRSCSRFFSYYCFSCGSHLCLSFFFLDFFHLSYTTSCRESDPFIRVRRYWSRRFLFEIWLCCARQNI